MNSKIKSEESEYLFNAILSLKNTEECSLFFEDLCTVGELLTLAQRLSVAKCLYNGYTNAETKSITSAAPATISRVNRSLQYGSNGYRTVIERLEDIKPSGEEVCE